MPRLQVNRKLEPFLTKSKPIKVAIGGRGSGKSIGFGDIFAMKMDTERADIYCLREFQDSINDSVHRVFRDSIEKRLKLTGWQVQENKVVAPNGALTTYRGAARNPDSIQSAQNYKYSWFEEAHRASKTSLDKLLPTILRNPGAECWFSANPQSSGDPFSKRFITPYHKQLERDGYYEDDMHLIVVVNWRDNPWWNEEQEALRAWDYANRPRAEYDWIWEGKFYDTVDDAIILPEWFDACIDAHEKLGFGARGAKICAHDPSDTGPDPKGLAIRHGSVFTRVSELARGNANEGADWALDAAIQEQCDLFVWDCDGLGVSLRRQVEDSLRGKRVDFQMFKGSTEVDRPNAIYQEGKESGKHRAKTNKETFKNKRSQYIWALRDRMFNTYLAVVSRKYTDPDQMISISSEVEDLQGLRSEVCRVPRKMTGNGTLQAMPKPEMKSKLGIASPNRFDSMMMCLVEPEPRVSRAKIEFEAW